MYVRWVEEKLLSLHVLQKESYFQRYSHRLQMTKNLKDATYSYEKQSELIT